MIDFFYIFNIQKLLVTTLMAANVDMNRIILPSPLVEEIQYIGDEEEEEEEQDIPGNIQVDAHGKLYRKYVTYDNFSGGIIEQANIWYSEILPRQIASRTLILAKNKGTIRFSNVLILKPSLSAHQYQPLLPLVARNNGLTYNAPVYATATWYDNDNNIVDVKRDNKGNVEPFFIGRIPVILGSSLCNLEGMSRSERVSVGEDANDPLGYCIFNGSERTVISQEKLRQDRMIVTLDTKEARYKATMTCASIVGTSIVNIRVGKLNTLKLNIRMFGKSTKRTMPIFGVYHLLGITDNTDIIQRIVNFTRPEWRRKLMIYLQMSLFKINKIEDIVAYIWRKWDLANSSDDGKPIVPTILKSRPKKKKLTTEAEVMQSAAAQEMAAVIGKIDIPWQEKKNFVISEIQKELFPHMADEPFERRIDMLSMMIAKLLEVMARLRPMDDRDNWAIKRVEICPRSVEQLFTGLWKKVIDLAHLTIQGSDIQSMNAALKAMDSSIIGDEFSSSFTTSYWGVKPYKGISYLRENVSEILKRESYLSVLAQLKKVNTPTNRKAKRSKIRFVQTSQLGYIDVAEVPEGENCGLVKYMTVTCHVSNQRQEGPIRTIIDAYKSDNPSPNNDVVIMFNGKLLGWCDGNRLKPALVKARRDLSIPKDTCIVIENNVLYVYCDAARLTRPLLVVDEADEELVIDKKNLWGASFTKLLQEGCVEYIDAWEQEQSLIAQQASGVHERKQQLEDAANALKDIQSKIVKVSGGNGNRKKRLMKEVVDKNGYITSVPVTVDELEKDKVQIEEVIANIQRRKKYTHCELDPSGTLSASVAIIPLPNHNQAPRNVYQAGMGKQSTGIYHTNHLGRFDSLARVLAFPSRPVFEPQLNETIGLNEAPSGFNALVAIYADPYNQEDAFVFKKEAVELGMGRYTKYTTYSTSLKSAAAIVDKFEKPHTADAREAAKYRFIGEDGMPMMGARLEPGDCVIGKVRRITEQGKTRVENVSKFMGAGDYGTVDNMYSGLNNANQKFVKVKIRDVRSPVVGDKYSSRSAQKGTFALARPAVDMPRIETGTQYSTDARLEEIRKKYEENEAFRQQQQLDRDEQERGVDNVDKTARRASRLNFVRNIYLLMRRGYYEMILGDDILKMEGEMLYYRDHNKFENKSYKQWYERAKQLSLQQEEKDRQREVAALQDMEESVNRRKSTKINTVNMSGLIPDILINPHSIPSRMTMGKMIEFIASKAGIMSGKFIDATAFRKPDMEEFERVLTMYGFDSSGSDIMYNGITGKRMEAKIYNGFIHYQALRHTVLDKIQARAEGSRTKDTRQPLGGRSLEGGLRVGEMERDAIISHGATMLLKERLCGVSDATEMAYCLNCSTIANTSQFDANTACHFCNTRGQFGKYTSPYAFKLVSDYLAAAGFNMKINMVPEKNAIKRNNTSGIKRQLSSVYEAEKEEEDEDEEEKDEEKEDEDEEESDVSDEDEGGVGHTAEGRVVSKSKRQRTVEDEYFGEDEDYFGEGDDYFGGEDD